MRRRTAPAPTPDPTDGHAPADAIAITATAQLDAVAHAVAEADAAADVILFADLRAVAGTVRVAVGGPLTPPDAPAPDGRADAEADTGKVSFLFYGGRRGGHEDADHFFEFAVCLRLRRRDAAAFYDSGGRRCRSSRAGCGATGSSFCLCFILGFFCVALALLRARPGIRGAYAKGDASRGRNPGTFVKNKTDRLSIVVAGGRSSVRALEDEGKKGHKSERRRHKLLKELDKMDVPLVSDKNLELGLVHARVLFKK